MARKATKSTPPQSQEFIDDSDAMLEQDSGDEDVKPASKKASKDTKGKGKADKKAKKEDEDEKNEEEEDVKPAAKKRKVEMEAEGSSSVQMQQGEDGVFADLGNKKRVSVREFKGTTYVDIREFYEDKSGEMKPGKKGISMNVETWETLKGLIPSSMWKSRNSEK